MEQFDKFIEKGKCCSCESEKSLDSMVRKDYKKGLYECIDCKALDDKFRYAEIKQALHPVMTVKMQPKNKIIRWCFG